MRHATALFLLVIGVLGATPSALGAAPRGSQRNPYPLRTLVRAPDTEGWKLRVNKTIPNATRAVLKWNKFNTPPRAGDQFFIINVTLTYSGPGFDRPFAPTRLFAVGRASFTYSVTNDFCGGVPGQLNFRRRVRSSGHITGNICFSVSKTDVRSLLFMYQSTFSRDNRKIFFRLR